MQKNILQQLVGEGREIFITYRKESDEVVKAYHLEAVEIKTEYVKEDDKYETYLYAVKLPRVFNSKIQRFIVSRIVLARHV